MPRPSGKKQSFYNYEVILDEEKTYHRTLNDLKSHLDCAVLSILRIIKDESYIMKKFKDNHLVINKVRKPIFTRIVTEVPIIY